MMSRVLLLLLSLAIAIAISAVAATTATEGTTKFDARAAAAAFSTVTPPPPRQRRLAAAPPQPSVCPGIANTNPFFEGTPRLNRTVPNGQLFFMGGDVITPNIYVVHLHGTPFEWGVAYGQLFGDLIVDTFLPQFWKYMELQIQTHVKDLPKWLVDFIATDGIAAGLEFTVDLTDKYIPDEFRQEAQGVEKGSRGRLTYKHFMGIAMFPQLIRAACSIVGAYGPAVDADIMHGHLLQLRALDWGTEGPFQQWPAVITYHPLPGNGHAFTSVGWIGVMGSITGVSSARAGIQEKVWYKYKGPIHLEGIPFTFMLRDILQYDTNLDQALSRVASANRSVAIFTGLGFAADEEQLRATQFRVLEYSGTTVNIFNWNTLPADFEHKVQEGLLFIDKHTQPSHAKCFPALFDQFYGLLTADVIKTYIAAWEQTGNMHACIYDWNEGALYVANASPPPVVPAYDRIYARFNMTQLWNTAAPN